MTATDHNQNICTHNVNTPVNVAQEGDSPPLVQIFALEDDAFLGATHSAQGFIALLKSHQTVPDYFYADCDPEQWAVWCDIAWNSIELAAYSNGDRGVAQ